MWVKEKRKRLEAEGWKKQEKCEARQSRRNWRVRNDCRKHAIPWIQNERVRNESK